MLVQPVGGVGLTVPRFTLIDGRSARRAQVTWLPQRYLEMLLFNRTDGGSSGAVSKLLAKSGLGSTAWLINSAAVTNNELSQAHADFILATFKDLLPSNSDAILGGRTRNVTLIPIASAAAICRNRGRSPSTTAFLQACAPQQMPRSWELQVQQVLHLRSRPGVHSKIPRSPSRSTWSWVSTVFGRGRRPCPNTGETMNRWGGGVRAGDLA